ncbi:hypothetical protein H4S08_001098 [Coemansia sp. RSA 1365]|nr:hypothetical protein H4S08_001098 [Coemansia sp. RSA 1365]
MSKNTTAEIEAVQACIAREWLDSFDKFNDPTVPQKDKPKLYKNKSKQASGSSANKWNINKGSTMANQKDFLDELRRQLSK